MVGVIYSNPESETFNNGCWVRVLDTYTRELMIFPNMEKVADYLSLRVKLYKSVIRTKLNKSHGNQIPFSEKMVMKNPNYTYSIPVRGQKLSTGEVIFKTSIEQMAVFLYGDEDPFSIRKVCNAIKNEKKIGGYTLEYVPRDYFNNTSSCSKEGRRIGVFQINEDGSLVKFFNNIREAAMEIKKTLRVRGDIYTVKATIRDCVSHKDKVSSLIYGFRWEEARPYSNNYFREYESWD